MIQICISEAAVSVKKILEEQSDKFISLYTILFDMSSQPPGCSGQMAAILLYRLLESENEETRPAWYEFTLLDGMKKLVDRDVEKRKMLLRSVAERDEYLLQDQFGFYYQARHDDCGFDRNEIYKFLIKHKVVTIEFMMEPKLPNLDIYNALCDRNTDFSNPFLKGINLRNEILGVITNLGYTATEIPKPIRRGVNGVKFEVWSILKEICERDDFEEAWDALRKKKLIKDKEK